MHKIKVDGKVIEGREFQNMPQALAFAFQNGQCHSAKTLEIAEGKAEVPKPKVEEAKKPEIKKEPEAETDALIDE